MLRRKINSDMLPTPEKISETCVKEQLLKFIEAKNILIEQQSGFRKHHSCESSLNFVVNGWKEEIQKGKVMLRFFIHLKRALETLDRNLLLEKLNFFGLGEGEME
jgi:hypothetical protein